MMLWLLDIQCIGYPLSWDSVEIWPLQAFIFKASESYHSSPLSLIALPASDLSLPYMIQQIDGSLL